jgi:ATP-dependent Lhr-like helicase
LFVDVIHAIEGTILGSHLALTLERLNEVADSRPQRIGLSATQRPLEEIARFLSGSQPGGEPTATRIVDCGLVKKMTTVVESPVDDLNRIPGGTIWPSVAPHVLKHIRESRTTLVFVNNRAQAEKMAVRINTLAGEELALPYHGSLSKERRLYLEQLLKAGSIRALVTTSSLELGIDIGTVDLVVQVQSPKRVSSGLQRVGRAGHTLGAVSRGIIIPTFRDDAVESVAIAAAMRDGDVEPTTIVQNALDVLAQIIVAIVAVDDEWTRDSLREMVRRAYPYSRLTEAAFDEVLEMLSGKYPSDVSTELDARITWDRVSGRLSAPRSSRMMAIVSGGTIPDRGLYTVNLPDRTRVGELDEEFVHETRIGDIFQLGSSTWKVQAIEHDRVIVLPAPGAPARMPFWHGEYMARSPHVATRIGELRRDAVAASDDKAIAALAKKYQSDKASIASVVNYVREQRAVMEVIPDDRQLVIEQFRDEIGSMRVVVHAPFGGRVNAPWGMALAHRVREHLGDVGIAKGRKRRSSGPLYELQVQTSDDGIMLRLPSLARPLPVEVIRGMTPDEAKRRVLEEVGGSSLFGARFRMNAARALLLPRGDPRRRMPLWLQRLKALDLLQSVREHPSFPILVETYRDVLSDAFDMPALERVLTRIGRDELPMIPVETRSASPFASTLQFGFVMDWLYGDDAPRAEQRAALLSLDRALLDEVLGAEGADAETLAMLSDMLAKRLGTAEGFRARSADDLAVLIDRAGDLTRDEIQARVADPIGGSFEQLVAARRVVELAVPTSNGTEKRFTLTENLPRYLSAFGETVLSSNEDDVPEGFRRATLTPEAANTELLGRLLNTRGAMSIHEILDRYRFDEKWVRRRLSAWRRHGRVVRGTFGSTAGPERYCVTRLLEIARRRELARARRQIQAVDLSTYARFVERWQHLHPETRATSEGDANAVIRQFYGMGRPADWWLREGMRGRIGSNAVDLVSRLMNHGEAVWIADPPPGASTARLSNVRLLKRGTARQWISPPTESELSDSARAVLDAIRENGASFFDELIALTSLPSRRFRDALRELVGAGLVTSDSLEALRLVSRWRVMPSDVGREAPDPTRWIPVDPNRPRPVVQRRGMVRRLPKWRRPDVEGVDPDRWPGRWSLARTAGILGPSAAEPQLAEAIARQWIERYGIVAREHWRRERPPVPWRSIYLELRRLEMRGEVRRGYFVEGLSGMQFAKPEAVDQLRSPASPEAPIIILSASDPANVQTLPQTAEKRDNFASVKGRGAWLATLDGVAILVAESRGKSMRVRPGRAEADIARAARAMANHLVRRSSKPRDLIVEAIDGRPAATSPHYPAFASAGFRRTTRAIRYFASI